MPEQHKFTRIDIAFSRFLTQRATLDNKQKKAFEQLIMTMSYNQNQGHNCIRLTETDKELILASGMASCEVLPATKTKKVEKQTLLPLVIEQNRLYLQRYWFYENRLARKIADMSKTTYAVNNLDTSLDRYFTPEIEETDWQREAAKIAIQQAFCIITGGPGTGKTTTVIKILVLLQELAKQTLHIALAAPTGKAAMRLQESIESSKASLPCSQSIKNLIPTTVYTLHRLLGAKPPGSYFHHHADKPLLYDLVVVDEASMVDLALMSKLFDALKPDSRLILLGDKNQLASVESGAVLADLTAALPAHTLELKKYHRFNQNIKALADAVNNQQAETAWEMIQKNDTHACLLNQDLIKYIAEKQTAYLQLIKAGAEFNEIYQAFKQFQVLCSNRIGKKGIADINNRVEQELITQKFIIISSHWYSGRPFMITQNNPAQHLYNGDIGLCMPDKEQSGKLMVFFQGVDGNIKKYLPTRISHCETVYAMTIHKSQGSEFEEVLIVLPETVSPLLTKELLYTAITRAKKTVKLVTDKEVFTATVKQKVERVTGLLAKFQD